MISLFTIASNDQSVYYLGQIFGYVGNVIPISGAAPALLGNMFKTLNTTALVLGSFIVVHTIVMGLLKTAQEGEFLGKQWNSFWVPLRTVMGIASLFPTASGYSILQTMMMWFVLQGVGAADALWNTVIDYVSIMGSPTAQVELGRVGLDSKMKTLFQGLTCEATAFQSTPTTYFSGGDTAKFDYYCADPAHNGGNGSPKEAFCENPPATTSTSMGPNGACGSITYCNEEKLCTGTATDSTGTGPQSLKCGVCKAQKVALASILKAFRGSGNPGVDDGLATFLAKTDKEYIAFYENQQNAGPATVPNWLTNFCSTHDPVISPCCVKAPQVINIFGPAASASSCVSTSSGVFPKDVIDGTATGSSSSDAITKVYLPAAVLPIIQSTLSTDNFIQYVSNFYASTISGAITDWLSRQTPTLDPWQAEAKSTGWLMAGAYYYKMANQNAKNLEGATPELTITGMDPNPSNSVMNNYRNNYQAAADLITGNNDNGGMPPAAAQLSNELNGAAEGLTKSFMDSLGNSGTNPLASLAYNGEALMISAQVIFPVYMIASTVTLTVASVNPLVLGSGLVESPFYAWAKAFFGLITPLILAFCAFAITFGGMLGIYTPLIPYFIYTFGVIGWFTATIEAMVAAPIVALGILSPSGQHEILGKAEPAVLILLNTFLRPSLMVIGMMAGMLMSVVVVKMINAGFLQVMGSINKHPGPVELILFLVFYTTFIITALNKCFALIHMIPERVLTWIGGQAISYGESEGAGTMKSSAEGGTATVGGGAKATGEASEAAGQGAGKGVHGRKDQAKREEEARKVKAKGGTGTTDGS